MELCLKTEIKRRIEAIRRGEVPEGYRKTKAGIVPEEWEVKKANEIFKNHSNKKHGGKYPVLSSTQINGIIPRDLLNIDIKYDKNNISMYKKVECGDYVISLRSFQGGIEYSEYNGLVSPAYTVLKSIIPISPIYYKEYFKTPEFISRLNSSIYGIRDGKQIGYEDFSDLSLHYPPYSEQQKIVKILSACDKVIQLKENILIEKRKQKKWLLGNLMNPSSGVRLPRFKGEWEKKTLGELGVFSKGFGISNDDCCSGKSPCIKYGDIYMNYNYFIDKVVSHTEENIAKKSKMINSGTLLFTGSGEDPLEIGKCVAYLGKEKVAIGGDIIIMVPYIDNSLFLSYQQYTSKLIGRKAELSQGYSVVHIYADQIKSLIVFIPPTIKEQETIANILLNADDEINLLDQELKEWCIMKKALMQVLLAGIVRV
jgi:type I restriction enzyme S subunit